MMKSFRMKLISSFLVVILLSMITLTLFSNVLLMPIFIQNSKNTMEEYYPAVETALTVSLKKTRTVLETLNVSYGITTHVVSKDADVICSYTKVKTNSENRRKFIRWIELYESRNTGEDYYFRNKRDDTDNVKKLLYIRKTPDGKYVIMNKAVKGIEQDIKIVSFFLLIMGMTTAVTGTVVWSIFTKRLTDNIKKMSSITQKMSELDFSEKINLTLDDEIGTLACSIDRLSDELEASIAGLKEDVERQKRLVRDISHELKTPVTTVKGYIENVQALSLGNRTLENYCNIASEECDVIDNLVEEMLEMSRLESQGYICDMEKVSASSIRKGTEDKLSAEFREESFKVDFEDAEITCNYVLVMRAIMNFVKNAVKYGDSGALIEISGKKVNGYYVFSVANKGKPISDEEKENIWDLFYKNDKSRQRNNSHGIGLSIVRQIAVLHKGSVNLESKDGKNIFSFTVPV